MPYNANIPQPGDLLSQSQADLLGNFQALSTLININHVDFASADQGKHKFVTFPVQGAFPPILAGEIQLFNIQSPLTGVNELAVVNSVGVGVPVTASNLSNNPNPGANVSGWTILPSGVTLVWGQGNANGNTAVLFPVGPNLPVFTNVMSIQLTTYANNAADTNTFVRLSGFNNLGFNCYGSQRTAAVAAACSFQYLAIGY